MEFRICNNQVVVFNEEFHRSIREGGCRGGGAERLARDVTSAGERRMSKRILHGTALSIALLAFGLLSSLWEDSYALVTPLLFYIFYTLNYIYIYVYKSRSGSDRVNTSKRRGL